MTEFALDASFTLHWCFEDEATAETESILTLLQNQQATAWVPGIWAYEVLNGNTSDRTTLKGFLKKIGDAYGKARRVWVMDRGIPSEALLKEMREPERQTYYLVGTPKGKINQHEKKWLGLPWQKVRDSVEVKLYEHEGELYVLAKSQGRQAKENAIRRKRLARLLRKLRAMRKSLPKRDQLLLRIGVVINGGTGRTRERN